MQDAYAIYQQVMLVLCVAALAALVVGVVLYKFRTQVSAVMRWMRQHPVQSCVLAPMVVCAVLYGGSKPGPEPIVPTVKGITLGEPMETPGRVALAWKPDEGTEIATNQRVRVYWRDAANPSWSLAVQGYGITNAVVEGFFVNRDTDWQVVVSPTNAVEEVEQ